MEEACADDLRIAQDVLLWPKCCALASTIERVSLPRDVKGRLSDKSTWARRFVGMMNTRVDPGFSGYLTLEIINHSWRFVRLRAGMFRLRDLHQLVHRGVFDAARIAVILATLIVPAMRRVFVAVWISGATQVQ